MRNKVDACQTRATLHVFDMHVKQQQHNQGGRISMVFKASLLSASGKRGHGLGRHSPAPAAAASTTPTTFKLPPKKRKQNKGRTAASDPPGRFKNK